MAHIKKYQFVILCLLLVGLALVADFGMRLHTDRHGYTVFMDRLGEDRQLALNESTINPEWLISGSPSCGSLTFGKSHDGISSSGVWECRGPAKFEYHYGQDEFIFVLNGTADIQYVGKTFTLTSGESTHFAAGTKAVWTVHEHIRKAWWLHEPGRHVRYMRKLMQ